MPTKCATCEGCGRVGTNPADADPCPSCYCDNCKAAYGERPCRECGWTPEECEEAFRDMNSPTPGDEEDERDAWIDLMMRYPDRA